MENYTLSFDEALRTGIKNDSRLPSGAPMLDVCTGLRPTRFGLKDYLTITQPMSNTYLTATLGGALGWPFPQLFRGKAVTLLCFASSIFEVNETNWTATELALYDAADFGDTVPGADTITAGGPWHFMDFNDTWVLFNGISTIFKTGYYANPVVLNDVTIQTGADMKHGRAYMGGFTPSNFYALADWPAYWSALLSNAPAEIQQQAEMMSGGAGSNWVWWSTIGGGDLLWLVSKELYTGDTRPLVNAIQNGDFDEDLYWSYGSGWEYNGTTFKVDATTSSASLSQSAGNMIAPLITNRSYVVTYTVSNRTSGGAGSVAVALGSNVGTSRSSDGTYTETLAYGTGSPVLYVTGTGFTGSVDNISVTLVPTTAYSGTLSPIREIMQRNEFGLAPMPWQGTVLHQKQLGDTMMVYGDGGLTALIPGGPIATHGLRDLQGIGRTVGIASRSAVGGNIDGHIFVDSGGEVWRLGPNLQAERLGYGHIFSNFLTNDIIVSHDPQRNEFYIAGSPDSAECYVLTETGLGKAPWVPTQVSFCEGGLISILLGDTVAGVQVETNKFGARRRKQIDQITTVTLTTVDTDATGWSVIVEYRFRKEEDFLQSASVACDARGVARMNVSGLEFRVLLTHLDRTKADLDAVEVEMAHDGRRSLSLLT